MPTNEERREAANRIRESVERFMNVPSCPDYGFVIRAAVNLNPSDCSHVNEKNGLSRLADLIEPEPERTCHMVQDPDYDFVTCSHCGYEEEGNLLYELGGKVIYNGNYCPNCGAKVIQNA